MFYILLFIYKYCHTSMFASGLLKATAHDLTSLFMTRMQCIGLAKMGDTGTKVNSIHVC